VNTRVDCAAREPPSKISHEGGAVASEEAEGVVTAFGDATDVGIGVLTGRRTGNTTGVAFCSSDSLGGAQRQSSDGGERETGGIVATD